MMPISGVNNGAVQPLTTAEKVLGASRVQKPEEESQGRQPKPVMDEYVPEEPREPSGRYWVGKDEDGQPKIYFDDRSRAEDAPKQPEVCPYTSSRTVFSLLPSGKSPHSGNSFFKSRITISSMSLMNLS